MEVEIVWNLGGMGMLCCIRVGIGMPLCVLVLLVVVVLAVVLVWMVLKVWVVGGGGVDSDCGDSDCAGSIGGSRLCWSGFWVE